MAEKPLLELKNVTKKFAQTTVLEDVNFSLHKGEILGLVGENGAGKTTLMSILFGMPVIAETGGYGGNIIFDGEEVHFKSPFDALDAGIGMVHQEFSLIPGFIATENIMLNREITKTNVLSNVFGKRMDTLNRPEMTKSAEQSLNKLGIDIKSSTKISEMPVGHKQFVEIAREISRSKVRLLVLDEPTAVLTESEAEILLDTIRKLAAEGIAIIFISHRLREITEICDRVVTLRDGKTIRDIATKDTNINEIAASLVGREVSKTTKSSARNLDTPEILKVEDMWVDMPGEVVNNASFSVKKGEIFGIAGLAGQGKIGIPNGIMGLYPAGGKVTFDGKDIPLDNTKAALDAKLAFVSEDRRGVGLLLDESLDWNIAFTAMQSKDMFLKPVLGGLIKLRDDKAMKEAAEKYIDLLEIKCNGPEQKARELSGGNQQKVCLAKAFCLEPDLLFVSEPTRGIDVGAKQIVLDVLKKRNQEEGTTIVMVSSELEELRSICDRIAVVYHGKIVGILSPEENPTEFALYMSGEKGNE